MRLIIISNRLPITVKCNRDKFEFQESVGGLTSGLSAYLDSLTTSKKNDYIWVGWPGISVEDEIRNKLKADMLSKSKFYPVFISESVMDKFYHGFCNKTIWPLFHYFPSYVIYDEEYWMNYRHVNEIFCKEIMQIIKPDDVIWIQDYHLMLLPELIRKKMPEAKIGFFLHIPFPSFEIFRLLPSRWREDILRGLVGADLIGFHTNDYTQYFLRSILRILGYEHDIGKVIVGKRVVKVDTFPMGIDFKRFYNSLKNKEVRKERNELSKKLAGQKIILSIDRLDYSKGIINRLKGYDLFLEKNPEWRKKVILMLIVVPSRVGVEHYQQMKRQIDEIVGKINSKFGDIYWMPILYQYKTFSFYPLTAVYGISDVALITPLRDGMNLIAKEYVSTRHDKTGVLIISEMAGACKELGEALIINPNNIVEIADALKSALEMPRKEQIRRNTVMQARLKRYNVTRWAEYFIQELVSIKEEQREFESRLLNANAKGKMINDFRSSEKRIIFLDYDGTLVPFTNNIQMAKPSREILSILKSLSDNKNTEVVLISGRDKKTIQNWFGMLNISFVAEHGAWIKEKGEDWKKMKTLKRDWKAKLIPILERYVDRLPNSSIEEKEFSIAWHYRNTDSELAPVVVKELIDELITFTANINVQIFHGNKVVEIRSAGVDKGSAAMAFIVKKKFKFILALGDDATDEDLFKALPQTAYSVRVGMVNSYAKFNLPDYSEVKTLLKEMIEQK